VAKAVSWNAADVAVMVGVDVISAVGVVPEAAPSRTTRIAHSSSTKRNQLFGSAHNETLSVIAVSISNPDRSSFGVAYERLKME
jgi:hypothetical protein